MFSSEVILTKALCLVLFILLAALCHEIQATKQPLYEPYTLIHPDQLVGLLTLDHHVTNVITGRDPRSRLLLSLLVLLLCVNSVF